MATVTVSDPSGAQGTRRPTIEWSVDFTPLGGWHIYVYEAGWGPIPATGSSGELPYAPGSPVYEYPSTGWFWAPLGSAPYSHVPLEDLPLGSLEAVVVTWSGYYYWDTGPSFSFSDSLSVPTGIVPATGSTITTNLPVLQATIVSSVSGSAQIAEWQFATDAGFTANVRTVTEAAGDARTSGTTTETVPTASKLFASTSWRVRARAKTADGSITSSWSSANTFTVAHLPSAVITSPTNGGALPWSGGQFTVTWAFSSTSSDLTQSAYQVVVTETDDTPVSDTGKITSSAATATISGLSTGLKGDQLKVKVRVWDTEDVVGSYSTVVLVTLHDAGTVTVTAPTGTISNPTPAVTWTFTPSTGGAQERYRVVITLDDDDTIQYDSGWVITTATSHTVTSSATITTAENYTTTVTVRDAAGVEASDTLGFATSWVTPDAPTFTVEASTFATAGPVTILIDTSAVDMNFAGWTVQRRVSGTTTWTDVLTTTLLDAWVCVADYEAVAGVAQEWRVKQLANRYGVTVPTADGDMTPIEVTPPAGPYWLITDANTAVGGVSAPSIASLAAATSMILPVVGDRYTDELEQVVIPIVGRGRKVECGTAFGVSGQLDVQWWGAGSVTAREQRETFEAWRAAGTAARLRTPFGQVFQVVAQDVTVTRVRAASEAMSVTIPYAEVMD